MRKLKIISIASILALSACGGSSEANESTTTTESAAEETLTLVAVGDISCSQAQRNSGDYDCADEQVANLVRQIDPNYALLLGDIQYNSHTVENFDRNFGVIWSDIIPISMPIPGNHEYAEGGAKGYYAKWGDRFGPAGYYSRLLNNDWVLIGLNTNDECSDVDCRKGSEQYAWLGAELNKYSQQCVISMMHHPRYSSGNHGSSRVVADMFDLMDGNNVPLVLTGHDHHYERFETYKGQDKKPVHFVVGTGGKSLRSVGQPINGSVKMIDDAHGVLVLEIQGKTVKTYFVDIAGNILDSHTLTCAK
jgi:hypothetical protein